MRKSPRPESCRAMSVAVSFAISFTVPALAQTTNQTPNGFFTRGEPTFVIGTAGDDRADHAVKSQALLIRDLLFPGARVIDDSAVEVGKGSTAWPANPILYGGPHVNHVLAKLGASLPFRMERGQLNIGDQLFEGDEYRLITVVPRRAADSDGPGYPEFLLYAGNGMPGVAEINAVRHGTEPILIADAFGRLFAGDWKATSGGRMAVAFRQPRARRLEWRTVDRQCKSMTSVKPLTVHVRFPRESPAANDEEQVIEACVRGLEEAAGKLDVKSGANVAVYVFPGRDSIASLTGQSTDGHAVVEASVLHVVHSDAGAGRGFEKLLVHEGAHVLGYHAWGPAGTPLLGEGVAVWASGAYGGLSLKDWIPRVKQPVPSVATLLGKAFRQMPESQAYPLAGIFVLAATEKLGIGKVRQHLYAATASTWETACKAAGATPQEMEGAFRAMLTAP